MSPEELTYEVRQIMHVNHPEIDVSMMIDPASELFGTDKGWAIRAEIKFATLTPYDNIYMENMEPEDVYMMLLAYLKSVTYEWSKK